MSKLVDPEFVHREQIKRPAETASAGPDATIELLCERWPRAFSLDPARRRPLKIGVFKEVWRRLGGAVSHVELQRAFARYVGSVGYLARCRAGADRVDLDGEPAGTVTEKEDEHASGMLLKLGRRP